MERTRSRRKKEVSALPDLDLVVVSSRNKEGLRRVKVDAANGSCKVERKASVQVLGVSAVVGELELHVVLPLLSSKLRTVPSSSTNRQSLLHSPQRGCGTPVPRLADPSSFLPSKAQSLVSVGSPSSSSRNNSLQALSL